MSKTHRFDADSADQNQGRRFGKKGGKSNRGDQGQTRRVRQAQMTALTEALRGVGRQVPTGIFAGDFNHGS